MYYSICNSCLSYEVFFAYRLQYKFVFYTFEKLQQNSSSQPVKHLSMLIQHFQGVSAWKTDKPTILFLKLSMNILMAIASKRIKTRGEIIKSIWVTEQIYFRLLEKCANSPPRLFSGSQHQQLRNCPKKESCCQEVLPGLKI